METKVFLGRVYSGIGGDSFIIAVGDDTHSWAKSVLRQTGCALRYPPPEVRLVYQVVVSGECYRGVSP